jgi:hypothetical protein
MGSNKGNKSSKSGPPNQSKVADRKLNGKSEAVCRDISTLQDKTMQGANVFDYLQTAEPTSKKEENPEIAGSEEDAKPADKAESVTNVKDVEKSTGEF